MHKTMHLTGQLLGGSGIEQGAWRLPQVDADAFIKIDVFVKLAQEAERGGFDSVFFTDTPALIGDISTNKPVYGLEPTVILSVLANSTEHIGLVATVSTTFSEAYTIARQFRSIDLISGGRAGINFVTTNSPEAGANYGIDISNRKARYERAHEFIAATQALWGSWGEEALIMDKASGRYADMSKIKIVDYRGKYLATRGPISLPPSPQGQPIIFQAGGGQAGLQLASRFADATFSHSYSIADAQAYWQQFKQLLHAANRNPDEVVVYTGMLTSVASTEEEALRRRAQLDELGGVLQQRVYYLGKMLNIDLSEVGVDEPVPREIRVQAVPSPYDPRSPYAYELVQRGLTLRDIIAHGPINYSPVLLGTPETIANQLQTWFEADIGGGFSITPDTGVDGMTDFVDHVIPILRRRGLVRERYEGTTLRQSMGIRYRNGPAVP